MSSQVSKGVRLPAALLKKSCIDVFTAVGVPQSDAAAIAETLVLTDLRGIHSHGVIRSARYID